MSKKFVRPTDFIVPININRLEGRMLKVPSHAKNSRNELLLVYGLESNLERWWGLVTALRRYGNVTMMDLPGLGGMDSFYTIGRKPTLDNMADYLAAFVKLQYKRKRLSIFAIGFGFSVVTRMLQRNPELKSKVNIVICMNGYAHKDDFKQSDFSRLRTGAYSKLFSQRIPAYSLKMIAYNPLVLKVKYRPKKVGSKDKKTTNENFINKFRMDLIKENDLRTRVFIANELLMLDNCRSQVDIPLWHITLGSGRSDLNNKLVEQHIRVIYKDYNHTPSRLVKKIPLVFNDEKMAIKLIPSKLRRELKKSFTKR
jgi:pimeloyl-ACP methyl ester carboxylesterase